MEEVCVIKTGPLLSSGPVIKGKWGGQHQPHTEVVGGTLSGDWKLCWAGGQK